VPALVTNLHSESILRSSAGARRRRTSQRRLARQQNNGLQPAELAAGSLAACGSGKGTVAYETHVNRLDIFTVSYYCVLRMCTTVVA